MRKSRIRAGRAGWVAALGLLALSAAALGGCVTELTSKDLTPRPAFPRGVPATARPPQAPEPVLARAADGREWRVLALDGLHDPRNEAIADMREPSAILATLPAGGASGDRVNWVAALQQGAVTPREKLRSGARRISNIDVVMPRTAAMPEVLFPHRPHTEWLDCANCHDGIFIEKAGANRFNMADILRGEYCGVCHGKVAFPPTECDRCHSVAPKTGRAN